MKRVGILIFLVVLLTGCAGKAASVPTETTQPETTAATQPPTTVPPTTVPVETEPPAAVPVVLECQAPGILTETSEDAVIDYSNSADGYIMACFTGECSTRLKLRVSGPGNTYTYNLPQGEWNVFPLSDGDGSYKITIYRGTGGSQYAVALSAQTEVVLRDEFAPFLRPNQYVNYANAPQTLALGEQLCTGLEDPLEKVAAVYDYVVDEFQYDYGKASSVKSGYLPVLDTVLAEKKGICFDYAALMAAVLRSQQIPCKLVVGYAGSAYHAWISVWTEENGWIDGVIFFDGLTWKRMDPTFASSSERSESVLDFIENGTYTEKYLY